MTACALQGRKGPLNMLFLLTLTFDAEMFRLASRIIHILWFFGWIVIADYDRCDLVLNNRCIDPYETQIFDRFVFVINISFYLVIKKHMDSTGRQFSLQFTPIHFDYSALLFIL
jgi:hypothetical protein